MKDSNISWSAITDDTKQILIKELTSELSILRVKAKITQEELARAIGISRQTYSQIECNKSKMSWTIYLALLFFFSTHEGTAQLLETLNIYPNAYIETLE